MLVRVVEPREVVLNLPAERPRARAQALVTTKRQRRDAAATVVERRVDAHTPGRQVEIRVTVVTLHGDACVRLAQDQSEIAVVPRLEPSAPIRPVAARRRKLRHSTTDRALSPPVSIEREAERLPRGRARR